MSKMVERVAKAIAKAATPNLIETVLANPSGGLTEPIAKALATAAIAALREPTEAMWAGWRSVNCAIGEDGLEEFTYFSGDYGNWLACHHSMIDAALK